MPAGTHFLIVTYENATRRQPIDLDLHAHLLCACMLACVCLKWKALVLSGPTVYLMSTTSPREDCYLTAIYLGFCGCVTAIYLGCCGCVYILTETLFCSGGKAPLRGCGDRLGRV